MIKSHTPILGFCAWSGTGKTTLIEQLIPLLNAKGLRVALIKHTHHHFDMDQQGKDSYRFRKAGAQQVVLASSQRIVSLLETPNQTEAKLESILAHIQVNQCDLILVEGFKHEALPKIELHRPALQKPLLYPEDPSIIALASDFKCDLTNSPNALPFLDLNKPVEIADFIIQYFALQA